MKERLRPVIGYAALFALAFTYFAFSGIDAEGVKQKTQAFALDKTGAALSIGELALSPFGAAEARTVELTHPVDPESGAITVVRLRELGARVLLRSLVTLSPALRLTARTSDGFLRTDIATGFGGKGISRVSMEARSFNLGEALVRAGGVAVPFDADVHIEPSRVTLDGGPSSATGAVKLRIDNVRAKKDVSGAFLLEKAKPRSAVCEVELKDGALSTKGCRIEAAAGSADIELALKLRDDIAATPLAGTLIVKAKDKTLESLLMLYQKYKKPDGAYHFPLRGTLGKPSVVL